MLNDSPVGEEPPSRGTGKSAQFTCLYCRLSGNLGLLSVVIKCDRDNPLMDDLCDLAKGTGASSVRAYAELAPAKIFSRCKRQLQSRVVRTQRD